MKMFPADLILRSFASTSAIQTPKKLGFAGDLMNLIDSFLTTNFGGWPPAGCRGWAIPRTLFRRTYRRVAHPACSRRGGGLRWSREEPLPAERLHETQFIRLTASQRRVTGGSPTDAFYSNCRAAFTAFSIACIVAPDNEPSGG